MANRRDSAIKICLGLYIYSSDFRTSAIPSRRTVASPKVIGVSKSCCLMSSIHAASLPGAATIAPTGSGDGVGDGPGSDWSGVGIGFTFCFGLRVV